MENISEAMYQRIKSIISNWVEADIYAISFFVHNNEVFEYNEFSNISTFAIRYNSEHDCSNASE